MTYTDIFHSTTGNTPYDYQCRLGCGVRNDRPEVEWLAGGTECRSQLINDLARLCKKMEAFWQRANE